MLSGELKALNYNESNMEKWEDYVARVEVPEDKAIRQFYRQVVFDHFVHHNDKYPDFEIDDYSFEIVTFTVNEIRDKVRFFEGESIAEMWREQYDDFERRNDDYIIFQRMFKDKTPPFPPIVIDSDNLADKEGRQYSRPIHLIEGTHRVSYLLRMAEKRIIPWDSKHEFVLLKPKVT
jgi:hypothetical protein